VQLLLNSSNLKGGRNASLFLLNDLTRIPSGRVIEEEFLDVQPRECSVPGNVIGVTSFVCNFSYFDAGAIILSLLIFLIVLIMYLPPGRRF